MIHNTIPQTTRQLSPSWCRWRDAVHWADKHKTWFTLFTMNWDTTDLEYYLFKLANVMYSFVFIYSAVFVQGEQLCPGEVQPENPCETSSSISPPPSSPPPPPPQLLSPSLSVRLPPLWPPTPPPTRQRRGTTVKLGVECCCADRAPTHRPTRPAGQARPDMFGRDAAGWQLVRRPVSVKGERTWMWAAQPGEGEWFKRLEIRFFFFFCYLGCQCVVFILGEVVPVTF